MNSRELTVKQKKFVNAYIKTGNATQSAIEAGYSKNSARQMGNENLTKPYIKSYIDKKMKAIEDAQIAKAEEVLKYLTSVMRGQETEDTPLLVGDGTQELVSKGISAKERIRAAELIGRRYALFTDKIDADIDTGTEKLDNILKQLRED